MHKYSTGCYFISFLAQSFKIINFQHVGYGNTVVQYSELIAYSDAQSFFDSEGGEKGCLLSCYGKEGIIYHFR